MKKALIIIAAIVAAVIIGCGVYYFIADSKGKFEFEVLSADGLTARLVKFDSHRATDVVIPDAAEIGGKTYKVTQIGIHAFRDCQSVEKVTVPASVTEICAGAFLNCFNLAEVVLPETIVRIGSNEVVTINDHEQSADEKMAQNIIDAASALSKILPEESADTVADEDSETAADEDSETAADEDSETAADPSEKHAKEEPVVEMPGSEYFAEGAFEGCTSLTKINLPKSLESIGHNTFRDCIMLAEIAIPSAVGQIGMGVFRDCRALTAVTLPDSLKVVDSQIFAQCCNLQKVVIPEGVEVIGEMAFEDCESLAEVNIPSTVAQIGALAFAGCHLIKSFALPERLEAIGVGAFNGTGIAELTIPASVEIIAGNIVRGCVNLASVAVAAGNKSFKSDNSNLYNNATHELLFHVPAAEQTECVVPEGIDVVASFAFDGCKRLRSVVLPASVKEIGELIFSGCDESIERLELKALTPPTIVGSLFGLEPVGARRQEVREPVVPSRFSLIVPDKAKSIYEESLDWSPYFVDYYGDDEVVVEDEAVVKDDSIATANE